jgi:hypothetical protein
MMRWTRGRQTDGFKNSLVNWTDRTRVETGVAWRGVAQCGVGWWWWVALGEDASELLLI